MRGAGLILSVGLHAGAAALAVIGWPYISPEPRPPIPDVPIELISEAELADEVSIPEMSRAEEETPEPDAEPEPEEVEPEPEPAPAPEPEPEPAVPPPPDEAEEPEAPEEELKAEPDPEPAPPEPEPEDDLAGLDDVLKNLDPDKQDRRKPREVDEAAGGPTDAEQVGTGRTLTITEEAALKKAFLRCWQEPGAVPDAEKLVVRVRVRLNRNGTLNGAPVVLNAGEIDRSGNRYWQAARINAVAAVTQCAPYDFLPDALIEDAIREGGFDYAFRPEAV